VFFYRNKGYFVYSRQFGAESCLVIAPLRNPWTLGGPEVVISKPDRDIYPVVRPTVGISSASRPKKAAMPVGTSRCSRR
jgi:hypothetical protein